MAPAIPEQKRSTRGQSIAKSGESQPGRRRQVTFGPYVIGPTLGEGEFGKVKLGWSKNSEAESKNVAIKLIRRDTIPKNSEKEVKIYREINALKHLSHPNIVTLEEVLQNSKYIGIVLQYASGGEFYKYIQKKRRLKEPAACKIFAQLTSGVHYMHYKGLAHRDLKLENLLLDEHENLIITDFGFVNEFTPNDGKMKTSCGSPCYAAPELVVTTKPYEARKADIWSCGVILYAMLAGYLPWDDDPDNPDGDDIAKLYNYITKTPLKFPEYISPIPRDMLRKILISNPEKRISIEQIENHQWMRAHALFLSLRPEDWDTKAKAEINNIFRPPPVKANHSRYTRPHSNSSVSSTEKRNSLIFDSTFHPQPVPPQESQSHAIAKPSSPSSDVRTSPIKRRTHSRSNSAASLALQAVVDAEREFFNNNSGSTLAVPTSPSAEVLSTSSLNRLQNYSTTRSGTHNASSLMNRNSTIIELSPNKEALTHPIPGTNSSPSRDKNTSPPTVSGLKQSPPYVSSTLVSHSGQQGLGRSGLAQHNRPRPTSYHPVSTTLIDTQGGPYQHGYVSYNSEYTYSTRPINGSTHGSRKDIPEVNGKTLDSNHGQNSYQRAALRNSTFASTMNDSYNIANTDPKFNKKEEHKVKQSKPYRSSSKRYSIATENGINTLNEEVEEAAVEGTLLGGPRDNPSEKLSRDLKNMVLTESSKGNLRAPSAEKTTINTTDQKGRDKRFSILSFYSYYNNSKVSVNSDGSQLSSQEVTSRNTVKSAIEDHSQRISSNQSRSISATTNYSDSAKSRIPSSGSTRNNQRHSMFPPKTAPITSAPSASKKRSKHASVMVSSPTSSNDTLNQQRESGEQREQREPSTAKKVFDFFKRRSMRL